MGEWVGVSVHGYRGIGWYAGRRASVVYGGVDAAL